MPRLSRLAVSAAAIVQQSCLRTRWHWIDSGDFSGYDAASVVINGSTVVDECHKCYPDDTDGCVKHVVDVSSYPGQTVSLQTEVDTDSTYNSNLFIDDVSIQATASSAQERGKASHSDLSMSHSR